jgi:hypothetical protein
MASGKSVPISGPAGQTTTRTWRRRILLCLIGAIIAYFGYGIYRIPESIREAYALGWVSGMVVDFIESNDGRWPQNWDDLRDPYNRAIAEVGQPWSFEELRGRVDVDFSANPDELAKARPRNGSVPFRVITLRSGDYHYWEGSEPNLRIWDCLQQRAKRSDGEPETGK